MIEEMGCFGVNPGLFEPLLLLHDNGMKDLEYRRLNGNETPNLLSLSFSSAPMFADWQ